ncbi:hypothetical protein ACFL20_04605 [Spirochaetota bacterium]
MFAVLLPFIISSCGKSGDVFIRKWEGVRHNKLRVYTRHETAEDLDDKAVKKKVMRHLTDLGKKRAFHLIINYIRYNKKDPALINNFNGKIRTILNTSKIVLFNCEDESCEAVFDFNIGAINKELNLLKK